MWRRPFGFSILKIVSDCISERELGKRNDEGSNNTNPLDHKDMLSRFIDIQSTSESILPW